MQTTLILLKPDTIERGLIGNVISRIEAKGLQIAGMKMIQLDNDIINEHYAHIADKPFFPAIVKYMQRTPVIAIAAKGKNAVLVVRSLIGATNPLDALPGTVRGDLALNIDANIIHASDSEENAEIELKRFFKGEGIFEYSRLIDEVL
ncbi:nucleoside-diphosphate kinase [Candidatus Gracilibacteria bacterium HOT-871]|nr:nucleoside-diphosphate kinase [Candidatus Gracilibacteria bacterium HOT-871]MBB1564526.1 nucleoside-diphosphate kinase [Candidatus Gracilibacteria bacterium]